MVHPALFLLETFYASHKELRKVSRTKDVGVPVNNTSQRVAHSVENVVRFVPPMINLGVTIDKTIVTTWPLKRERSSDWCVDNVHCCGRHVCLIDNVIDML